MYLQALVFLRTGDPERMPQLAIETTPLAVDCATYHNG
jgi:hypothetical protein